MEVGDGSRSALCRILEGDAPASAPLVLMVADVLSSPANGGGGGGGEQAAGALRLALTDGWYAVSASPDRALADMAAAGQLTPGAKLFVAGAELQNHGPAEALDPSHAAAVLRLSYNSVWPAPPDAPLGEATVDPSSPWLRPLHDVKLNGGPIACMQLVVQRRYPLVFWDRAAPAPAGRSGGHRTARHQAAYVAAWEKGVQGAQEEAVAAARQGEADVVRGLLATAEQHGSCTVGGGRGTRQRSYSARVIRAYAAIIDSYDGHMGGGDGDGGCSSSQLEGLGVDERQQLAQLRSSRYAALVASQQAALMHNLYNLRQRFGAGPLSSMVGGGGCEDGNSAVSERDIGRAVEASGTPVLRLRVASVPNGGGSGDDDAAASCCALLRIWRPTEELESLYEGDVVLVAGLAPCGMTNATCGAVMNGGGGGAGRQMLELQTAKQTRWELLGSCRKLADRFPSLPYAPRSGPLSVRAIGDLPVGSDFDATGLVVGVGSVVAASGSCWQWVFLAGPPEEEEEAQEAAAHRAEGTTDGVAAGAVACDGAHEATAEGDGGDDDCGAIQQRAGGCWLLAVRLLAPAEALDWLDPSRDVGCLVSFRDLVMDSTDGARRMWVAIASELSSHAAVKPAAGTGAAPGAVLAVPRRAAVDYPPDGQPPQAAATAELAAWAAAPSSAPLITALRRRVEVLMRGE